MSLDNQTAYWDSVAAQKTFTHPVDISMLKGVLGKQSSILDFGCGYGRVVKLLLKAGFQNVAGYDTSQALISRGKADASPPIHHIASPEHLPVEDGSQDCILLFAVLTCIPSNAGQMALMNLLHRKLRPGGFLYISDYYLQQASTEVARYECLNGDAQNYGVFTLPEGATFRHHPREWVQKLTAQFPIREERLLPVSTMNGHAAEAYQLFLQKPHSMNVRIETASLVIREMLPEDDEAMFAMDSDAEVHRYLGGNPYASIQQSRDNIAFIRQQYADHGIGRWAVTLKETGEFIGWTGFKRMKEMVNGHIHHLDFGYRHARKFWRQGYGYEAAKAALDYGIEQLGFRGVYAMTDVDNAGSWRLLEKLGFRFVEIFAYDGVGLWLQGKPTTWYEWPSSKPTS